ncbi:hypothetical protein CEXT_542381 [Caerostris extrusa]|uniref:Uncharacterized protein n=1 Tax=Caerostris extrusa TaxID=172846 RepID=A0AAV4NL13_CAEEX|nr:hypothetical protein CEXT_542381 [Caerostris extrusa]
MNVPIRFMHISKNLASSSVTLAIELSCTDSYCLPPPYPLPCRHPTKEFFLLPLFRAVLQKGTTTSSLNGNKFVGYVTTCTVNDELKSLTNVISESKSQKTTEVKKSAENTLFFEAKGKIEGLWGGIEVHTRSSPLEGAGEGPSKAQAPPCSLKIRSFVRNGVEAYWYPPNLSGRFQ